MRGPDILVRTLSKARQVKPGHPCPWQYHPRSDHHSRVACWGVLFDLLLSSHLLREHVGAGLVAFGINHRLVDHTNNRAKNLDLVLCRPAVSDASSADNGESFADLATRFRLVLTDDNQHALEGLPKLRRQPVGSVLMAMEAKAAMTEFGKARPRLYDELQSSHSVVHGDTDAAIAVGFAMINGSDTFISPTRNTHVVAGQPLISSTHDQPEQLRLTIDKVRALPRREVVGKQGFDAIAAVAVNCRNDGTTPVTLITEPKDGAVPAGDVLSYATMINRVVGIYANRFPKA